MQGYCVVAFAVSNPKNVFHGFINLTSQRAVDIESQAPGWFEDEVVVSVFRANSPDCVVYKNSDHLHKAMKEVLGL